jgi:H+/gluconate symporter-like permease
MPSQVPITVYATVGTTQGTATVTTFGAFSPHHIVITPSTINVPYGTEATLQAKAYNAAGVELPVPEDGWTWTTSETTQLHVELTYVGNTATVRTNMPSQVPITVYATVGTTQGTATVTTFGVTGGY